MNKKQFIQSLQDKFYKVAFPRQADTQGREVENNEDREERFLVEKTDEGFNEVIIR